MKNKQKFLLISIAVVILTAYYVLLIPSIRESIFQEVATLQGSFFRLINPPAEDSFLPQIPTSQIAMYESITISETSSITPTIQPVQTWNTATPTSYPLPASVRLSGVIHEYQQWNNCGPATLAMALSFWSWTGDQRNTAAFLKPNPRDKNVSVYELLDFVNSQTNLRALSRVGGDIDTIRRLIAAGFPVIIERGLDGYNNEGWMGHYQLLSGYDDSRSEFIAQDSLIMPDLPVHYEEIESYWPQFNNVFIVVYPMDQENQVFEALGNMAIEANSYETSMRDSRDLINHTEDRDLFFNWFNLGTDFLFFENYAPAANAYDQAFLVYANLPEESRPWRMMWYQHGPYQAYYELARYQDVINLATFAISRTSEPALEEAFYWRGLAELALGDEDNAFQDLQTAVNLNIHFQLALDALTRISP
jgi:hypothetical protein